MSLPEAKPGLPGSANLDYSRTINYIFENPNWLMNAVWMFLCQIVAGIIPIVPQMVVAGYQFEALDTLLTTRGARYPDFNINRLSDYLGRGVWPVLAMLVASLVWIPVILVLALCSGCVISLAASGGKDAGPILVVLGILVVVVLITAAAVSLMLIITPVTLRAGISQDFGAAFDLGWIGDFLKKMWVEVLMSSLFIVACALLVTLLTCGLGSLIVAPLVPFVQAHFWYQLYIMYLDRGGMPIPFRPASIPPGRQLPSSPPTF